MRYLANVDMSPEPSVQEVEVRLLKAETIRPSAVQDSAGNWAEPKKLVWDDPRGSRIYVAGCIERVTLPNGDILLPL